MDKVSKIETNVQMIQKAIAVLSETLSEIVNDFQTEKEKVEEQIRKVDSDFLVYRNRLARREDTSELLLAELAEDGNSHIRKSVARNPSITPAIIEYLARDKDTSVRFLIAVRKDTPKDVLQMLAHDPMDSVRINIALRTDDDGLIKNFLEDECDSVRSALADNPNLPAKYLCFLSTDRAYLVRASVARNPRTEINILRMLAADKEFYVLFHLSENPSITDEVAELLLAHKDILKDNDHSILSGLARNTAIGKSILQYIYKNYAEDDSDLEEYIFNNPSYMKE